MILDTLSSEDIALLKALRNGIQTVLGDDLVGLYLYGSAVHGDFTPGISDVDLVAATRRFMTVGDIDRLRVMHRDIVGRHPAWHDRVEVAYQSLHGLRTWATERSPMGIISPGEPIHLIDAGAEWRINWYLVFDHGTALTGPPPEAIIPPISRNIFIEAARESGISWRDRIHSVENQRGESYAILTTCRALYTRHTCEHVSKQRAAARVAERHPEWSALIAMALDRRVSKQDDGPVDTYPETVRFINWATAELQTTQ